MKRMTLVVDEQFGLPVADRVNAEIVADACSSFLRL
jgi:hypothetical protein